MRPDKCWWLVVEPVFVVWVCDESFRKCKRTGMGNSTGTGKGTDACPGMGKGTGTGTGTGKGTDTCPGKGKGTGTGTGTGKGTDTCPSMGKGTGTGPGTVKGSLKCSGIGKRVDQGMSKGIAMIVEGWIQGWRELKEFAC